MADSKKTETRQSGHRTDAQIAKLLADAPEFKGLKPDDLEKLVSLGKLRELPSGSTLFQEGDPSDHLHVVTYGRLRITEGDKLIRYAERLETVGELGFLSGNPRATTVRAVRDSAVLSIDATEFRNYLDMHPAGYRNLMKVAINRLRNPEANKPKASTVQGNFAVIPSSGDVPVRVLAEAMVNRLTGWPAARLITAEHIDAALGEGTARAPLNDSVVSARIADYIDDLERRHQYLVFAADSGNDPWASRCLHNADRVLVLAEALTPPMAVPVLEQAKKTGMIAPIELVLLRPEGDDSPHTMGWREITRARAHYFVHPWERRELDSLARQVTSRGVTLVLGGGGARGFAHIGLMRAMEEMNIPVDVTGGTSMGAFMAALIACGHNSMDMTQIARETFVRVNYLNDLQLPPKGSLIKGQRFGNRLGEVFGDRTIEELRKTFFCVGTNITTGQPVIADEGPLAKWVAVSMCVPGVAPPVAFKGDLLCDGGVVDNLPIEPMRRMERGAIIACNVSADGALAAPGAGLDGPDLGAMLNHKGAAKPPRLAEVLVRTAMLSSAVAVEQAAKSADIYLKMPIQGFGMFDWKAIDDLVDLGYETAKAQIAPARDLLL